MEAPSLNRSDLNGKVLSADLRSDDQIGSAVEEVPISEAPRGIIAGLQVFDLPTDASALEEARIFLAAFT
jgi:hypothetical protein